MLNEENLNKELAPVIQEAQLIVVEDEQTFQYAGEYLMTIKGARKKLDDAFDPIIAANHQAHKTSVAQKKKYSDPLDQAERVIKGGLARYLTEQENKRRQEQARIEAELKRKSDEEALARAQAQQAAGDTQAAQETITEAAEYRPVVHVEKTEPKIAGLAQKKVWKFQIADAKKINPSYMIPDEKAIGATVRSLGEKAVDVIGPGIKVWQDTQISARA